MQPLTFLGPLLYAIFLWWFITGLIMAVYGRSPRLIRLAFGGATLLLLGAMWGIVVTRQAAQPRDVYLAVTCGLLIWGWQTVSYYLGFVTGPPAHAEHAYGSASANVSLLRRFWHASRASLYHELLVIAFALLLAALTWSHPNRWGLWIFLAMWLMHLSAKLNIFLGVRNFRMEFLPPHLHHLDRLLNKRPHNLLLPISVVLASSVGLLFVYRAIAPETAPAQTVGFIFVATMIGLGVMEHLLLVLPLPSMLWGWGTRPLPHANRLEREEYTSKTKLSTLAARTSSTLGRCAGTAPAKIEG